MSIEVNYQIPYVVILDAIFAIRKHHNDWGPDSYDTIEMLVPYLSDYLLQIPKINERLRDGIEYVLREQEDLYCLDLLKDFMAQILYDNWLPMIYKAYGECLKQERDAEKEMRDTLFLDNVQRAKDINQ